jgi:hypothetical protein
MHSSLPEEVEMLLLKLEVKFAVVAANHGDKRELDVLVMVVFDHHYG